MTNLSRILREPAVGCLTIIGFIILCLGTGSLEAATYVHGSPVQFQWSAPTGSIAHYNVYVSVDGQPYQAQQEVGTPSCQLNVADGRSYRVQVEAENSLGESGPVSDPSEEIVVFLNGSDADIDGDGMPNTWEQAYGFNPLDPADAALDPDLAGLTNRQEYAAGTVPGTADTDGDGMLDGEEVAAGLNPTDPSDNVPVAHAGADQESDPTLITLNGTASFDPRGGLLSYLWTQSEGPQVDLSDPVSAQPTFLGTARGVYRFRLVVTNGLMSSLADEVRVTIRNVAPTADAGPDRVADAGAAVPLDGSGSWDPNGDSLTYAWARVAGTGGTLSGNPAQTASFVSDTSGVFRFALVVNDGLASSVADEVQVVVNALNQVPTANAGADQTVTLGATVVLDGSGSSDPDGDTLQYAWTQAGGPATVSLQGAAAARASFVPSLTGVYTFELVVEDGTDASPADPVKVTVLDGNHPPVALILEVPPVTVGDWVRLDGAGSFDPDGDTLTWLWTQVAGPQVQVQDRESAATGFYATTEGTLTFQLVVSDGDLTSEPAGVVITVNGRNQVPVADAGQDRQGAVGAAVCLDGSGSFDPDLEDTITYSWSQAAGTRITLQGADTASPCFTPAESGVYTFELSVFDGELKSAADAVSVTVDPGENLPPVAVPGAHVAVLPGTEVQLDGTGSQDPDGVVTKYLWKQTSGPSFPDLTLVEGGSKLSFVPDKLGYYVFSLKVSDGELWSEEAFVVVWSTNNPPANCSMLWTRPEGQQASRSDILFVATLFVPALGMLLVQRRRMKKA